VGRLSSDISVQRGAAHTTVHKPADPGRAHDCVPVQSHQDVTARRPVLGAAGGGKLLCNVVRSRTGGGGGSFLRLWFSCFPN